MNRIEEIYTKLYNNYNYNHSYMDRVKKCNDTVTIPKVANAGEVLVKDGFKVQVMHNGILIHEGCYHQQWVTDIIKELKGHHEPQEEKLFHEILKVIPDKGIMIECGSFWSYYSLWFHHIISNPTNIMVEPMPLKCEIGELNFKLNGYIGDTYRPSSVFRDWDGSHYNIPSISIDWLMETHSLSTLHLLHADIQANEQTLLKSAEVTLKAHKIDFLFLGTHSPNRPIREALQGYGYHILQEFEAHESFFDDGLIVACAPHKKDLIPKDKLKISKYVS